MKKLLGILFLFITINASAQWNRDDTTRYIWYHYQYGTRMPRAIYDSVFAPPKDTVFSKKGLATKGSALYVGNGTYWTLSSGGGVGGLDSIRNNFNNTKIILWAGGIAKDSLAKGIIKYQIANFKVTNISPGVDSISYIGSGGGGASKYTTNQYGILVDSATANLYKIKADSTVLLSKLNANATYYNSRTVAPDSSYVTFNRPDGSKDTLRFTGATAGSGNPNLQVVTNIDSVTTHSIKVANNIKISNGRTYDSTNFAIGNNVLENITTGIYNTGIGLRVLQNTTTGSSNIAIGKYAMQLNTTSPFNIAIGDSSLYSGSSVTGFNTSIGFRTQVRTTTGYSNVSLGSSAMREITSGNNNTAIGTLSLTNAQINSFNTALGSGALQSSLGDRNTAIGAGASNLITTGIYNSSFGTNSLFRNITGSYNLSIGSKSMYESLNMDSSVAIGSAAMYGNSGSGNIAIGAASMYYSISGGATASRNVAIGQSSLSTLSTGMFNTGIGWSVGGGLTTGSNNTLIGARISGLTAGLNNNLVIADGTGRYFISADSTRKITFGGYGVGTFTGTPTYALQVDASGNVIEGTISGGTTLSGTGYVKMSGTIPAYQTPTQVTADLNIFTPSLKGLVTPSGGGTSKFMNADGTWTNLLSTTSGNAFIATSSAVGGEGILGGGTSNYGGDFSNAEGSSPSTVVGVLKVLRIPNTGTGTNGMGGSIDFTLRSDNLSDYVSNRLISKWTTIANATRTSEFSITGVNNAVTNTVLQISGAGIFTLAQGLQNYTNDAAAATGGIPIGGLYRNGSIVMIRVL